MARTRKAEAVSAAKVLGARGGRAGTGSSKRRAGVDYSKLGKSAWEEWTPEERAAEMRRRRRKGLRTAKAAR